jgi:hypothetical protein
MNDAHLYKRFTMSTFLEKERTAGKKKLIYTFEQATYLNTEFFMRIGFQFPIELSGLIVCVRHDVKNLQSDKLVKLRCRVQPEKATSKVSICCSKRLLGGV